ncbi:hypothetical protein AB833_13360 [Chromatiales bacterium (ex Bugula neritina AB1)]|nr:hypothetical protein AB833_13360 [Chromatiales bacterium (ex Bugula neritina AB1)]
MPRSNYSLSVGIPLLFVFLWSTGFIGAKLGMPYAEPFTFLLVRMIIAAALLLLIAVFIRAKWPRTAMLYLHAMITGVLIHGIYLGGVFFAISKGLDAGISALIVSLQPLITLMLSVTVLSESISPQKIAGIALGLAGVIIVISSRGIGTDGLVMIGLISCVFSLFAISAGTVYQKRFCADIELLPSVCLQYIGNVLFLTPVAAAFETMEISWTPHFIIAMTWLVLALSLGAVLLLMWLLNRGSAGQVASLFYLVPPFAAVEAWLLFGETLTPVAIAGIALCGAGVALVQRAKDACSN